MPYAIQLDDNIERELATLPAHLRQRVRLQLAFIAQYAETTPPPDEGWLKLAGAYPASLHFQVDDYRVTFDVDQAEQVVRVLSIDLLEAEHARG
jgi:mRNA-degrading endonuclease RelE of RelBE toxin-antitoxin system